MLGLHRHKWRLHKSWAEGFFSKRNEIADTDWYQGEVYLCRTEGCPTFLFKPFKVGCTSVECFQFVEDQSPL